MTVFLGKQMKELVVGEDDRKFLQEHATLVIHGGYIDRVLGSGLDKRIPHKDLPRLACPIVDTTTIDEAHDEQMFAILDKHVDRALSLDVDLITRELCSLGAVVRKWGDA